MGIYLISYKQMIWKTHIWGRGRPGKFLCKEVIRRLQEKNDLILFAKRQVLWQNVAVMRYGMGQAAGARPGTTAQRYHPKPTLSQEHFPSYTTGRATLSCQEASKEWENIILNFHSGPCPPLLTENTWQKREMHHGKRVLVHIIYSFRNLDHTSLFQAEKHSHSKPKSFHTSVHVCHASPKPLWDTVETVFKLQRAGKRYLLVLCLVWLVPDNAWHHDGHFN